MTITRATDTSDADATPENDYCDDCLTAAYDIGATTLLDQQLVCAEMGADMPDHLCIETEEPDLGETCRCACRHR